MKLLQNKKRSFNVFNFVHNRQTLYAKNFKTLLRKYKLSEIIFQNRYIENLFSHVFLGFSSDGAYLISYTTTCYHNFNDETARDFRLLIQFDEGPDLSAHPNFFLLHLWRFEPGSGLKFVDKMRLFNSECLGENSYIQVTQSKIPTDPDSPKPIIVYGCNLDKLGVEGFGQRCYKCHLSLIYYNDRSSISQNGASNGLSSIEGGYIVNIKHQSVNSYSEFFRREYYRPTSGYLLVHLCDSIVGIKVHFLNSSKSCANKSPDFLPTHACLSNDFYTGASTSKTSTSAPLDSVKEERFESNTPSTLILKSHVQGKSEVAKILRSAVLHDSVKMQDCYYARPGNVSENSIAQSPRTPNLNSQPVQSVNSEYALASSLNDKPSQQRLGEENSVGCVVNYLDMNVTSAVTGSPLTLIEPWDRENMRRSDVKVEQRIFDIEAYLSDFTSSIFRDRFINITIYDYDAIIMDGANGIANRDSLVCLDLEILIKLTFDGLLPASDPSAGSREEDPIITFLDTTRESFDTQKSSTTTNPYEWPTENVEDCVNENANSLKIITSHYYSTSVKLLWDLECGQLQKVTKDCAKNRIVFRRVLNYAFWRPSHNEYKARKAAKSIALNNIYHTLTNISLLKGQSLKSIDHPSGIYSIIL